MLRDGTDELMRHPLVPKMQTDRPDDDFAVVAEINLRLRRNGAMSIEGSIGDRTFALNLLRSAIDAIERQVPAGGIVVPGYDMDQEPFLPIKGQR